MWSFYPESHLLQQQRFAFSEKNEQLLLSVAPSDCLLNYAVHERLDAQVPPFFGPPSDLHESKPACDLVAAAMQVIFCWFTTAIPIVQSNYR